MIPSGWYFWISSIFELQGRTAEKTFCSRTRRAISCEYCAPKSRTTIDWVSTDEFLRSLPLCKEAAKSRGAAHRSKSIRSDPRQMGQAAKRFQVHRISASPRHE